VLPCVDVFVADEFCIWAPILSTCLALRWGAQLADVPCICIADLRWGAQLVDMPCICVADLRWGTQPADVPYIAFGHPSCGRALRCVGAPNLGEPVLKGIPPCQNLFLSILQLIF
jgi:hypothetical protein